jgi:tellurite resistance-related uncharacterized protein
MERPMVGFTTDADGHWVALLSCGHRQHVRHAPPLVERPWVTTEEGRRGRLGQTLNCVRCDAFEIPDGFTPYKRTDDFTETTIPAGLRKDHTTKMGVWARIVVTDGRLRYSVLGRTIDVTADAPAIVLPEVPHHVESVGTVTFHVEFLRAPAESA